MSLDAFDIDLYDENIVPLDCSKIIDTHQSPVLCRSILKSSNFDNLIELKTPQHKNLKVHFKTPSVAKIPVDTPPQTPGKQVTPTRYEEIRTLDDDERWLERTAVVTKADHVEYIKLAKEFVDELIANLPILREEHTSENSPLPQPVENTPELVKEGGEEGNTKDNSGQEFFDAEESLATATSTRNSISVEPKEQDTVVTEAQPAVQDQTVTGYDQNPHPTSVTQESEEFQDSVEPVEEKSGKMNDTGESSPMPIPKGSYNFNFDEFDENTNPFECKKGLTLSPPKTGGDAIISSKDEGVDENVDPFKTKSKVAMSPPKSEKSGDNVDPFQTKSKVAMSPPKSEEFGDDVDPFQTNSKVAMSPPKSEEFDDNVDPFQTKSKVGMSPPKSEEFGEDVDPFQTRFMVAASPPKGENLDENIDPFQTKSKVAESPPKGQIDENIDPFQSKAKMAESPLKGEFDENIDPFHTNSKMAQSPPKFEICDDSIDPFKTKTNIAQSPPKNIEFDDTVNPFETKTSVANSPPKSLLVDNSANMNGSENAVTGEEGQETSQSEVKTKQKKTPTKKNSPTKQGQKKFRKPAGQAKKDPFDCDIQIFAPGPAEPASEVVTSAQESGESNNNDVTKPESWTDASDSGNCAEISTATDSSKHRPLTDSENFFGAQEVGHIEEEEFKPAQEVFNDPLALDMLEKFGGQGDLKESALGRQSLYVKFDPLVKGAESPAILKNKQLQSVSESGNDDLLCMNTPPIAKAQSRLLGNKHPAARVLENNIEEEPDQHQVVDKLLSFSPPAPEKLSDSGLQDSSHSETVENMGSTEGMGTDAIVQVLKYSQGEWNTKKQELELDFQARLLAKERTWDKKLQEEKKETERKQKENQKLQDQIDQLQASNKQMGAIVAEFEKTISQMISEKSVSNDSIDDVKKERDQALEDLQSVEAAFSDLHRRYEKTKEAVTSFKKNEQTLKKCVTDYQERLKSEEQKYQTVKSQAEEKLDTANNMVEDIRKTTAAEIAALQLALKKAELRAQSIEESYEHKVRENKELAAICDELIAKVGGSS